VRFNAAASRIPGFSAQPEQFIGECDDDVHKKPPNRPIIT
jgi:hypothetical protein